MHDRTVETQNNTPIPHVITFNQTLNYFIWKIKSPFHHIQSTSTIKHTANFPPSTVSEAEPSTYQQKNDIKWLHFILLFPGSNYTQHLLQSTQFTTWYTYIHICSGHKYGPCRPHVVVVPCGSRVPKRRKHYNLLCIRSDQTSWENLE